MARYNNIRNDRFGNPYQLITALQVVTKEGEAIEAYKGFIELKGQLYKLEISTRQKEHKSGKDGMWVKVTAVKKNKPSNMSM